MTFIKLINKKKFVLISVFMFIFVLLNLLDGERGLISYYKKQNALDELIQKKQLLTEQLNLVDKKNELLTGIIDLDYLETLYRMKFMVGKKNEKVYIK